MLDFSKVYKQIQEVGVDAVREASHKEVVERAIGALTSAIDENVRFLERLEGNAGWALWPVAIPLEGFTFDIKLTESPSAVTVVGVDGSQIMPSHHEVHNCYLLNVGLAAIHYGTKFPPKLESYPRLHHRPDDLYPLVDRRRIHIDELFVSLERTMFELEVLVEQALCAQDKGLPVVAMYDGSLIPWSLDKMPEGYQETYLQRMESCLVTLKQSGIALIGYISHSRSSEIVNMLRTFICPFEITNCRDHCGHLNEEEFPCSMIWPLTDRQLIVEHLAPRTRSSFCLTSQAISRRLTPDHQICFSYFNLGSEIARCEVPRWLANDAVMRELTLAVTAAQVEKGRGYPVALSEAHNQAVIKAKDREQFFELIKRHLISLGVRQVRVSPKESRKRIGFV